jgi:DMSO/TMAO reductase YedYZ molybdopterin-dependent catalytic subunit
MHYARSLSLGKALDNVLLALRMNDQPLTPAHGFPLRAVVPGWYGMASVKWLQRVIVVEEPFYGYYQTVDYAFWKPGVGGARLVPITDMLVKALIARPAASEVIPAGTHYRVHGAAWSGNAEIAQVEVSVDRGKSWSMASLGNDVSPYSWRLWEWHWQTPASPGMYCLMARATDSHGRIQPMERDSNRGTYMVNHCLPVEVEIR